MKCGDANPKGNVEVVSLGGCMTEIEGGEEFRCTGCGVRFHKDCILRHFKLEKEHDWGRQQERKSILEKCSRIVQSYITSGNTQRENIMLGLIIGDINKLRK